MKLPTKHLLSLVLILNVPARGAEADPAPVEGNIPTRLVTEDVGPYIEGIRAKLAINSKDRGPFGLFQEPGKEPKKPLFEKFKRPEKPTEIPFQTIVDALPVAAVIAAEKTFMVGARTVRVGKGLPLVAGGRTFRTRVESVKSAQIVFRNLANNELAVKRLDLLPNGVRPGGGVIRPPGVVPDGGPVEVPLELDLGLPPGAPNR